MEEVDKLVEERIKQKEIEDKAREEAKAEEKAQVEYMKAKAEAEVKETSLIAQDATKALTTKLNSKVAQFIESSQTVVEKIEQSAQKLVEKGLQTQENDIDADLNRSKKVKKKTEYELEETQYKAFGLGEIPKYKWQQKIVEWGYAFWWIVLRFICFFTLSPVYIFCEIIKTQSKGLKFLAILVGVLCLVACIGGLTYGCLKWTGVV